MTLVWKAVHPDRWRLTTTLRKLGIVVHTSESGDPSAQSLINFMSQPGDRTSSSGRRYGASYHTISSNDPNDVPYMAMQGADHGPFSAPPVNGTFWHHVIPGRANQTRDEWLDTASRYGIYGAACAIVDKCHIDGIRPLRVRANELLAGDTGYCGHSDIRDAWGQTDHYDPGPAFPWDVLAADIALLTADEEDPMELIQVREPNQPGGVIDTAIYARDGLFLTWQRAGVDQALIASGVLPAGAVPRYVPRLALKAFRLYGAVPDNGTTTGADFGSVEP